MTSSIPPFADPIWLTRGASAYYKDSHKKLQMEVRKYVDTYISPNCEAWEAEGRVPDEVCAVIFNNKQYIARSLIKTL